MLSQFAISFDITVRLCEREDIPRLEWYGLYTHHREIFRETFERHERGAAIMLVASSDDFPVGQVWIDLSKKKSSAIGILYALRVYPCFQRRGIGNRLLESAEAILRQQGYSIAEIGVEKDNHPARLLYERYRYRVVDECREELTYTTPAGQQMHEWIEEWILHKPLRPQ